jgi:hypothetical protein
MACIITHAAQSTVASGRTISTTVKDCMNSPMALYMKVSGEIIKCTEPGFTLIPTVENGKVSTETASLKPKGKNNFYNKNKSSSERKNPNAQSPTPSTPCCKPWPKATRKPSSKTSVHSSPQGKLSRSKSRNPTLSSTNDHNKNGWIC